jgi:hypothetical protein
LPMERPAAFEKYGYRLLFDFFVFSVLLFLPH